MYRIQFGNGGAHPGNLRKHGLQRFEKPVGCQRPYR